jgi:hypothetical protein
MKTGFASDHNGPLAVKDGQGGTELPKIPAILSSAGDDLLTADGVSGQSEVTRMVPVDPALVDNSAASQSWHDVQAGDLDPKCLR